MFNKKLKNRLDKLEEDFKLEEKRNNDLENVINDIADGKEIITLRKIKSLEFTKEIDTEDELSYIAMLDKKKIRISQVRNGFYDYILTLNDEILNGYYINGHLRSLFFCIEDKIKIEGKTKGKKVIVDISKSKILL